MNKKIVPIIVVLVILLIPTVQATYRGDKITKKTTTEWTIYMSVHMGADQCIAPEYMELDVSDLGWIVNKWYINYLSPSYFDCKIEDSTTTWVKWSCNIIGNDKCGGVPFSISGNMRIRAELLLPILNIPEKYCGDGECSYGETHQNCPFNCHTITCGDGTCQSIEEYSDKKIEEVMCPTDCEGYVPPISYCGDGNCDENENWLTCPQDCIVPHYCGDNNCDYDEDHETCPQDCPIVEYCGDGKCGQNEDYSTCPEDCPIQDICGDGTCGQNENEMTCPQDCYEEPDPEPEPEPAPSPFDFIFNWINSILAWLGGLFGG